jgi:hypothetical protein
MSMHFHTLLRILTNNTQTSAHVQFLGHAPCDSRHAHAPPSLADKQKCTPLWRPCAYSNVWYVICEFHGVISYPVAYSVSFVGRDLDCTRWLVRVSLVERILSRYTATNN